MSAQQVCLLFVLFYVSFSQTEQLFVSVEVPYNGVESTCQSCTAGNSQPVPSMACRSDNSTWNNGIRPFVDPIPAGYIAKSINVTFLGSFGCSNYTGSDGLVTIDGTLVNIIRNVSATEDCACDGCMQEIFVSGHYINGWPRYIYGGNNTLRIAANASLCVASANVSIEYSSPTPVFNSYHPLLIPVNKTENITIIGKNFLSSMQLRCSFGGFWLTNTTYVGSTQLVCPAPAFPFVNTTEFQVIDDTGTPLLSGTFGWYKEPEILSFDPPNGASNIAVNVSLIGTGFFNSSAMSCKFGEVPILTVEYVNETMVICNDVSGKIYSNATNVTVAFSENQEDFVYAAEEYLFTGIAIPPESTSATPSITPSTQSDGLVPAAYAGIALAVLFLCLFCMGSTVLILQRNKSKNFEKSAGYIQYDEESNLLQDPTEDSDKGEGNISMSEITRMKQIEKGSFGVIYEAQWRGTKIAVKKLPPTMTDKLKNEFLQEAALMKSLRHPNILQYLGVATKGNEMCICMEFMPRGSLYRILHNSKSEFSRDKIKSICLDTVRGMNYLHHQNPPVIHRDLKSHNLLVDRHWQVKVCDFGLSRITAQNQTMTACGTPSWTAPEVLRNERYTTKADVYGFGVVVWELFSRSDPFPGMPPFQIVFAVGTQKLRPTIQPDWPLEWVDLISSCWNENPEARPSFAELIPILEDMNEAN